jgi:hypothetical protein
METKELIKAKKYFEKAKGKRIGTWMSELRRQFVIRMNKDGAESKHIKVVTFLRHDQIWHYLNRYKVNPEVECVVVENMDEWIQKGLYPISVPAKLDGNHEKTWYVLNEDPSYKSKSSRNITSKNACKWDQIIDGL